MNHKVYKVSLFTVLMFLFIPSGYTQSAFKVLFQNPSDDYLGDIAEGANNTYYAVGTSGY